MLTMETSFQGLSFMSGDRQCETRVRAVGKTRHKVDNLQPEQKSICHSTIATSRDRRKLGGRLYLRYTI